MWILKISNTHGRELSSFELILDILDPGGGVDDDLVETAEVKSAETTHTFNLKLHIKTPMRINSGSVVEMIDIGSNADIRGGDLLWLVGGIFEGCNLVGGIACNSVYIFDDI